MKAMFTAFGAIIVIAVAAWFALNEGAQFSAADKATGDAVRLD